MVQNHMLQILMMTAMNLPEKINACEIREEKRKVMETLRKVKKKTFRTISFADSMLQGDKRTTSCSV